MKPTEEDKVVNSDESALLYSFYGMYYQLSVLVNMRTGEVSVDPDESKTKLPD